MTTGTSTLAGASPPAAGGARTPDGARPPGGGIDQRLRRTLWLVACCLMFAVMCFATRPGSIIADTKIDMAVDPLSFLRRALQLWDPAQFGQLQNQAVGYLFPMGPFYVLGKLMALPSWVVQRLWLTAVFCAAFLGTVRLASRLDIGSPTTQVVAGLVYALSPRALTLMGVNSGEYLPEAMLPWVVIPLVALLREGGTMTRRQKLRAAAQSGVAVAACSGMNAASVIAVLAFATIYVLSGERSWQRWKVLAWWAPAVALATWSWTVPLLLLDKYGVSILPYSESAQVTTAVTSLANIFRGTEDWTTYLVVNGMPWWPVGFHISTGVLSTALTGLIAALGLGGVVTQRMPERRFLLWVLLAGIFIISSGYVSSLGNPLSPSLIHLINGPLAPLRNLRKFDPMIRLPIAFGIAQLLARARLPRRLPWARTALSVLTAVGLAGLALPAAVSGLSQAGAFPSIPSYWVAATNWLNTHADNQAVLAVPGARFGEYVWGRPMDDVLEAMFDGDWASTQLATVGSVGNTRVLDAIEQQVEAGEGSAGLTELMASMGIKYVIVRNDLIRSDLYGAWPARVNDAMFSSPGLVKVAQFGTFPVGSSTPNDAISSFDTPYPPVEIFRVDGAQPVASVVPAASTVRVYGGPESLLTLANQGLLNGEPVLLNSDSRSLPVSRYLITDSLRRRVRNLGEIRVDYSPTLTATQPAQTFEAADDYTEPSWTPYETVAAYHGIANVTASSTAAGIQALPSQSATGYLPFAAVDGNLNTMWMSGALTGPVHQWLQVDFDDAIDPGTIRVAFADGIAVGPPVTKVQVSTAAGSLTENVRQTGNYQTLVVPSGQTRWLRITIEGVVAEPYSLDGAQVGISEISIPGVSASRSIDAPDVHVPSNDVPSVLLSKAEPQPTGCMLTSLRWVCSPSLIKPTEEQYGFDHEFTSATAHPATLSGQAVMTNSSLIAHYVFSGAGQPQVTASSTYTSDPQDMAASAFDGNLATSWVSGGYDTHPVLKIAWDGVKTISHVKLTRPPGAAAPLQVLVTGSGGQVRGGVIGASGQLSFQPALKTDELTFAFSPSQLPVQISEVSIPGVRPLASSASASISLPCGFGPTIRVDGKLVPTKASGTVGDLLDERPLSFSACSAVSIQAGQNSVVEPAADPSGFDVQSALVDAPGSAALTAAAPVRAAPVTTLRWTDSSRAVDVAATQTSYLVVDQNYNAGWRATIGGRVLQPVRLDGWKQAWLLPAGTRGTVTMTYAPDTTYRVAVYGGLGTLALVILLAFVPLGRRRRKAGLPRPEPPAPARGPAMARRPLARVVAVLATGLRWLTGLALAGFVGLWTGGLPGLLIVPAGAFLFIVVRRMTAVRVLRALSGPWLVAALMLAVAVAEAAGDEMEYLGHSGHLVTALVNTGPQLACLVIVAMLLAELRRPGQVRRSGQPAAAAVAPPDQAQPVGGELDQVVAEERGEEGQR